jgi:23S rRNA maturation mini-RNase III
VYLWYIGNQIIKLKTDKMKTLTEVKKAYANAKTQATRTKIFNHVMLNGSEEFKKKFIEWQTLRNIELL